MSSIPRLPLFNPPCPHAHPVWGGLYGQGQRCGGCSSVPPCWLLIAAPIAGAYSMFGGRFILPRILRTFLTDDQQACEWFKPISTGLSQTQLQDPQGWYVFYAQGLGYWKAYANMKSAWTPNDWVDYGPNAVAAQPPDPHSHWVPTNWNCLGINTLQVANGGLGFPGTVTVQPFWG